MLAKRLMPCLDIKDGRVVKGVRFLEIKDAGDPVERAAFYDREGADELVFLDITASSEGRRAILDVVEKTADAVFIPFTVGGGIDSVDFMRQLLQKGADKVSINTSAIYDPSLISKGAEKFGSQCIVVAVDARRVKDNHKVSWEVYSHGGRKATGINVLKWVEEIEKRGGGEILLTSMDADGTLAGYDNELLSAVVERVSVPVIASGGAGRLSHLADALKIGNAHAVLVASILHYGTYTIADIKNYLREEKIPVRSVIPYPTPTQ